ncbi:hypothetical protein F4V43_16990 [Paenibacillus spiritus]|uniref:Type 4 fimbrial biogenesis protein PilX N-terminal domain-containing protein n=1 Tax=Paenibacillus spiritus TaxID=2496557 RepID=A0A5J5FWF3_9BACL|nr:hypothetical protein [Paenibacillus spiritus]KAA8997950.1 hypothetical protein F4V43_16990 [Paenibacillus spiritus]
MRKNQAEVRKTRSRRDRRLCSEEGSALVLVMFIVLLLTILGMGVLSAAMNGAIRTETRENDVQSLHLAEKGLDEATAYIQAQLAPLEDLNPDELQDILSTLDKKGLHVSTELGAGSSGTIEDIQYSGKQTVTDTNQQTRQYYIDVKASAMVNGVKRTLQQRITIDSYPDFLKYAFGSEHDVILNGAPLLKGNVYAGNELIVSDMAHYTYHGTSGLSEPTIYPKVTKQDEAAAGGGEVHVQSLSRIRYKEGVNDPVSLTDSKDMKDTANRILGIDPDQIKIREQKKFVQINVEESVVDKLVEAYSPVLGLEKSGEKSLAAELSAAYKNGSLNGWLNADSHLRELTAGPPPQKPKQGETESDDDYRKTIDRYNAELAAYKNTFMNISQSGLVKGNVTIDGVDYAGIGFTDSAKGTVAGTTPKWLIINGDLNIRNAKSSFISVRGNLLVTGNVNIEGKVAFDSTVFVLGRTTVQDAVIDGIGTGTGKKELVLISKGPVLVNRIDSFTNVEPSEMNAFFYTDDTADLYGVGSIFWLRGGFFAKGNLTVNAVRGSAQEPVPAPQGASLIFTEPQSASLRERFRVIYNHEIYTHQQSSLPRVRKVNISVGPLHLVPSGE